MVDFFDGGLSTNMHCFYNIFYLTILDIISNSTYLKLHSLYSSCDISHFEQKVMSIARYTWLTFDLHLICMSLSLSIGKTEHGKNEKLMAMFCVYQEDRTF